MADPVEVSMPQARPVSRLIRLKEVKHRVSLSRSTIYRWMSEGRFPKPVSLGKRSVAWSADDIDLWISHRVASDEARERHSGLNCP
jgi:prophage regulatory protein